MARNVGGASSWVRKDNEAREDILTQVNRSAERFKEGMEELLLMLLEGEQAELILARSVDEDEENITQVVANLVNLLTNPQDRTPADEEEETEALQLTKTKDSIEKMSRSFQLHARIYQTAIMAKAVKEKRGMERIENAIIRMHVGMSDVGLRLIEERKLEVVKVSEVVDRTRMMLQSFQDNYPAAAKALIEKSKQEQEWVEVAVDAMLTWLSQVSLQTEVNRWAERFKEAMEQSLMTILKKERAELALARAVEEGEENITHAVQDRLNADEVETEQDNLARQKALQLSKTKNEIEIMSRRFKMHMKKYQTTIRARTEKEREEMSKIKGALQSMYIVMAEVGRQFTEGGEREKVAQVSEVMDRTKKLIKSFKRHSENYQVAAMALMERSKLKKEWVKFAAHAMLAWLPQVANR